jgi:hypothetical protein
VQAGPKNPVRNSAAGDPEILRCLKAVWELAGFDIPAERAAAFLRFHNFVTSPQPRYITSWRADPKLERRWYVPHVSGVLSWTRGALAASYYHYGRLVEIEQSVRAIVAGGGFRERLGSSTIGVGGTRKMDFEYQAFVLAYRRCLDYLAGALACYFKTETNSFRTLPKAIAGAKKRDVARALSEAHARHADALAYVLADGRRSVRNRIAHYEFVSAGNINVSARGFDVIGGGEELMMPGGPRSTTLAEALTTRLNLLHACVDDMIDVFVAVVRPHETGVDGFGT